MSLSGLMHGFALALQPVNLLWGLLGTVIGVLPGIGSVTGIALLIPLTFGRDPISVLILLAGIYYGARYGGSTTSILANIPGESSSVMTAIEGHEMAKHFPRRPLRGFRPAMAGRSPLHAGKDRNNNILEM